MKCCSIIFVDLMWHLLKCEKATYFIGILIQFAMEMNVEKIILFLQLVRTHKMQI